MSSVSSFRRRLIAPVIAMLWLAGCVPAASSGACPPLVAYSAEEMSRASVELEGLAAGSVIERLLSDYAVLRAQVRACQ